MLQPKPVDSQTAAVMYLVLQEESYNTTLFKVTLKIDLLKRRCVSQRVMEVPSREPPESSTQLVSQPPAPHNGVSAPPGSSLRQHPSTSLASLGLDCCCLATSKRTLHYAAINQCLQMPLKIKSIRQLKGG